MLINCGPWIMFVVFFLIFLDLSTFALKSEHKISLPDRNVSRLEQKTPAIETAQIETDRPNRLDRKVVYPETL